MLPKSGSRTSRLTGAILFLSFLFLLFYPFALVSSSLFFCFFLLHEAIAWKGMDLFPRHETSQEQDLLKAENRARLELTSWHWTLHIVDQGAI